MKLLISKAGLLFPMLLCFLLIVSSCDDDSEDKSTTLNPDLVTFNNITLSGSQEVPPNSSKATGTFRGTYDPSTKILSYTITFAGIIPNGMHFHKGEIGEDGDIILEINPGSAPYSSSNPYRSPVQGATPALTAEQEADLLAGNWFLNVKSKDYPEGELRAQLKR